MNRHRAARNSEKAKQEYNKQFADNKRNVKENYFKIGDHVIVKQERKNKLTPNFSPMPYVVVERQHSRVTAKARNGHTITTNVSHFKKFPDPEQTSDEDEERQPIVQATITSVPCDANITCIIARELLASDNILHCETKLSINVIDMII